MLAGNAIPEIDRGPRRGTATERLCVVTREVKPVEEMLRFVIGPDGVVVPDVKRKLPGRGVWVTGSRPVLADAVTRQAFRRGFKADVKVPPDLPDQVENLLERAVLDALAIAHKAGLVAAGFAKVEAAIAREPVIALLHACDASADGRRKIAAEARRRFGDEAEGPPIIEAFTSTQLNLALGRPNVIHAALLAGSASETVLARWRSLERFRKVDPEARGPGARQPHRGARTLGTE
ncbi:MAG TPA: RNA-binding protein [Xanthobacteraceae bacterium]|jgi:predicted RNA-binding protein YlxR (DUF448 family)|nr:RNA-binding protein [Xanthobacteraceae bacterium]